MYNSFIRYMETMTMDMGQSKVYGFFEHQSIQLFGHTRVHGTKYVTYWITASRRCIYLAPYIELLVLASELLFLMVINELTISPSL